MPELAELTISSRYINRNTRGMRFNRIVKNPKHRGVDIQPDFKEFTIRTESRGKELLMFLTDIVDKSNQMTIRFNYGMTGWFVLHPKTDTLRFAHLQFESTNGYILSYTDPRSFGKWTPNATWTKNRGPCPVLEYDEFRQNILDNYKTHRDFKRPIYEVMMNQRWFNGIGNYLRAEILYRIGQSPFVTGREFIESNPELISLCHSFPKECINTKLQEIEYEVGDDYKNSVDPLLRCYKQPGMIGLLDKNRRVFWHDPRWMEAFAISLTNH